MNQLDSRTPPNTLRLVKIPPPPLSPDTQWEQEATSGTRDKRVRGSGEGKREWRGKEYTSTYTLLLHIQYYMYLAIVTACTCTLYTVAFLMMDLILNTCTVICRDNILR